MKIFIKEKPKSTQTNRTIKKFLWIPTVIQQINDTKEYRWLEFIYVEQNRYMTIWGWHDWKDRKYLLEKPKEPVFDPNEPCNLRRTPEEQRFHEYMEDNPW